jgi:ribonuclease P/MRP protein subunit RPP1
MNYYDFHVHPKFSEGKSSIEDMAKRAKILGYKGMCITNYPTNKKDMNNLKKKVSKISKKLKFRIFLGFEAKTTSQLKKLADMRKEYDVLLVRGSDLKLNRKAVETKEVDILVHPELKRKDSGLNHIMIKLAKKNNVAIEINFREILQSSKGTRSFIMHNITENIKLCKKYKTPLIICSGAVSHWQLKDPKILISMGHLLGLELNEAKKAVSEVPENIIKMIKERQNKNWVRPGVKVVK